MSGKKCPKCGRTNVEEALYCIYCGAYIKDVKPIIAEDEATIFEQDEITVRKSQEFQESHFGLTKFRDYKVIQQLPATGAEADTFLIEKGSEQFFLKLYRKGMEPKIEVLQKIKELSDKLGEYVVTIHEVGYDEQTERYFEVMEYVKYGNLKDLLKDIQSLLKNEKEQLVNNIIEKLAEAINALHNEGVVHRDLKPTNVLVRKVIPLELVLTDFGISREIKEDVSKIVTTSFKGTPVYMAPEEVSNYFGKEIDWWHLGIIVYEALVGSNPFSGTSEQVVIHRIVTKGIEIPEQLPKKYQMLLRGLLTRERSRRWGYEQIKAWLDGIEDIPIYYEYQPEISVETSEPDLKRWQKEGFTEQSAKLWANLGLTIEEAKEFKEYFNYADALEWVRSGFRNGKMAYKWYETGIEPDEAVVYENLGINPKQAAQLKKEGITAFEMSKLLTAEELLEWKSLGILDIREVVMIKRKGLSLDDVKRWKEKGVELTTLIDFLSLDFELQEAAKWISFGFEPKEAAIWRKYFPDSYIASFWKERGFQPDEAQQFSKLELEISELIEWKVRNFTPNEVTLWKQEGFEPEQAASFKGKMSPREARKLINLARLLRKMDIICLILFLVNGILWGEYFPGVIIIFTIVWGISKIIRFLNRDLKSYISDLIVSSIVIAMMSISLLTSF